MEQTKSFSIGESLSFGWNSVKKNPIIILYFLIAMALPTVVGGLISMLFEENSWGIILLQIVVNISSLVLSVGLIRVELNIYDKKKLSFENLYQDYKKVLYYFMTSIFVGLAVLGLLIPFLIIMGFVLVAFRDYAWFLIIPGIVTFVGIMYASIRWSFWPYLLVDKSLGPIASMKKSWEMTKGNVFQIFLLYLVQVLVILLGVIALILGLLVAIPVASLMLVFAYKKLSENIS